MSNRVALDAVASKTGFVSSILSCQAALIFSLVARNNFCLLAAEVHLRVL